MADLLFMVSLPCYHTGFSRPAQPESFGKYSVPEQCEDFLFAVLSHGPVLHGHHFHMQAGTSGEIMIVLKAHLFRDLNKSEIREFQEIASMLQPDRQQVLHRGALELLGERLPGSLFIRPGKPCDPRHADGVAIVLIDVGHDAAHLIFLGHKDGTGRIHAGEQRHQDHKAELDLDLAAGLPDLDLLQNGTDQARRLIVLPVIHGQNMSKRMISLLVRRQHKKGLESWMVLQRPRKPQQVFRVKKDIHQLQIPGILQAVGA